MLLITMRLKISLVNIPRAPVLLTYKEPLVDILNLFTGFHHYICLYTRKLLSIPRNTDTKPPTDAIFPARPIFAS